MVHQPQTEYAVTWVNRIADIPQAAWDTLAQPLKTPFLEWEWLNNLETSGSATAKTGWLPNHLLVWRGQELMAAAPFYIKGHSYGEFVFDHQWADLAQRLGVRYYPKLLGMTPFTPATGYRFLIAPGEDEDELTAIMVAAIDHFCDKNRLSGCHFLFVDPEWRPMLERHGFTSWLHHSYVWQNNGFNTFDDYLSVFNANQRRNIKRERKAVTTAGLRLEVLKGDAIPKSLFPQIYSFYSSTCDKFYWGSKYLTRKFFEQLYPKYSDSEALLRSPLASPLGRSADRVVLVVAYREGDDQHPVGMSFCLTKGDQLYGRYWGCLEEFDSLHFDACYYTPIEWAIANGIQSFDPGAGGQHKKRRGFPATANHSMHRFYNVRLTQILRNYIGEINEMEQEEIDAINQDLPFSKREINLLMPD